MTAPFSISPHDECTVIDAAGNSIAIACSRPSHARWIVKCLTAQNEKWREWSAADSARIKRTGQLNENAA